MIISDEPRPEDSVEDDLYEEVGEAARLTRNGRASVTENNRGHG
ncbi:hypothetical protein [Streptomyces sp. NPDC058145]